jgi:hypothetical protein
MVRDHQPGEGIFRSILPEEIDWKPFPAFPLSARLAVLVGEPTQAGPYVIRVKVPSGVKLMPHRHPEDRIYRSLMTEVEKNLEAFLPLDLPRTKIVIGSGPEEPMLRRRFPQAKLIAKPRERGAQTL